MRDYIIHIDKEGETYDVVVDEKKFRGTYSKNNKKDAEVHAKAINGVVRPYYFNVISHNRKTGETKWEKKPNGFSVWL